MIQRVLNLTGGLFLGTFQKGFHELGSILLFLRLIVRTFKDYHGHFRPILKQVAEVSQRALGTVVFAGFFVGAILVLQFESMLRKFDAQVLLGGLNTSATIREVGPLIISFLLAGKIGAYTTAELANMRVTEQIDAIESLGINSVQYLILPRFSAIILSSVILLSIGLSVSILGAVGVATSFAGMNFETYISSIPRFVGLWTLFEGLVRCVLFSAIVATVSTYKGYTASGGARGVGQAVTESAIYTNVYIVLANFVSASILEWIHDLLVWSGLK